MTIFSRVEVLRIPIPFTERLHVPSDHGSSPLFATRRDRDYEEANAGELPRYRLHVVSTAHLILWDTKGFRQLIGGPDINRDPIWIRAQGEAVPLFFRRRLRWISEYA